MKNHRELKIWARSHALAVLRYQVIKSFPRDEVFAVMNQMRRAGVSIPAHFAEGGGRKGEAELKRFLAIALGFACQLDYCVLLARELGYLDDPVTRRLGTELVEIRRMLGSFVQKLKA